MKQSIYFCTLVALLFICNARACGGSNEKRYEIINNRDVEGDTALISSVCTEPRYLRRVPRTRRENILRCCKCVGTSLLMATVSAGSAYLVANILNEEGTVNHDLGAIEDDVHSGVQSLHSFANITHLIERYAQACPDIMQQLEHALYSLMFDCNITDLKE